MAFVSAGLAGLLGKKRKSGITAITNIVKGLGSKPVDNTHSHSSKNESNDSTIGTTPSEGIPPTISQGQEEALPSMQNMNFSKNAQAVGSELWQGKMSAKDFNQDRTPVEELDPTAQAVSVNPPRTEPIPVPGVDDTGMNQFLSK
jgi:hypothetical protein